MSRFPDEYACFRDLANGLTYYEVPPGHAAEELREEARDLFIDRMKRYGYVGFSHEIDDEFHHRSTYIFVGNDDDKMVMTSRVTYRPLGTIVPFEMGIRRDGGSYALADGGEIVDINTYAYAKGYYQNAMPLLMAGFGHHAQARGMKKAFCLYDQRNRTIETAYESVGFVMSEQFPEPIYFPTFCYKPRRSRGEPEPVFWRIMEWDRAMIEDYACRAMRNYSPV